MFRFVSIHDTRDWVQESPYSRPRPVRGSGVAHECDHCGKRHEIHVFLHDHDTGRDVNVGTTCVAILAPQFEGRVSSSALYELHRQQVRDEAWKAQVTPNAKVSGVPPQD